MMIKKLIAAMIFVASAVAPASTAPGAAVVVPAATPRQNWVQKVFFRAISAFTVEAPAAAARPQAKAQPAEAEVDPVVSESLKATHEASAALIDATEELEKAKSAEKKAKAALDATQKAPAVNPAPAKQFGEGTSLLSANTTQLARKSKQAAIDKAQAAVRAAQGQVAQAQASIAKAKARVAEVSDAAALVLEAAPVQAAERERIAARVAAPQQQGPVSASDPAATSQEEDAQSQSSQDDQEEDEEDTEEDVEAVAPVAPAPAAEAGPNTTETVQPEDKPASAGTPAKVEGKTWATFLANPTGVVALTGVTCAVLSAAFMLNVAFNYARLECDFDGTKEDFGTYFQRQLLEPVKYNLNTVLRFALPAAFFGGLGYAGIKYFMAKPAVAVPALTSAAAAPGV